MAARANGAERAPACEADSLPFDDASFTAVACVMALMLLQPLDDCLAEIARGWHPTGPSPCSFPAGAGPLSAHDRQRRGSLLTALRRIRFSHPNNRTISRLHDIVQRHNLTIEADSSRRFPYPIATVDAAYHFVESRYLPGMVMRNA
jgi:ubiquinone/menaquinone biosynthesis C-methylase UbiE